MVTYSKAPSVASTTTRVAQGLRGEYSPVAREGSPLALPTVDQTDDPPSLQWLLGGWAAIKAWAVAKRGPGGVLLLLALWIEKVCKVVLAFGVCWFGSLTFPSLL